MVLTSIKPVERKRLFESVVEQLYDLILAGHLKPGEPLPPERELCERFQVSRTSIRSAIQVLEALGRVESSNGEATRIKKADPEAVGGVLSTVLFHDLADITQLYESRRFLESWVAFHAATRLTGEQIDHLEQLAGERNRELDAGRNGHDQDFAFHRNLAKYAGNEVTERLVYALLNVLFRILEPQPRSDVAGVAQHE
ncbi:MAG: GntR family transcriptional regulator, partial [Acidobacteria bacterium]|nr:GntR family transcriptional regulator [Acidobacteriota bacterium]